MRQLSPQTRQKLAILLKAKQGGSGLTPPTNQQSPNLASPPVINAPFKPAQLANPFKNTGDGMPAPLALNANKMNSPTKFGALKSKLKRF